FVIEKLKPSAFFGSPLVGHLVEWKVDQVLVVGGTTSGCVRATAVDAFSHNFRVSLVEEGCFDRGEASHAIALWDLNAKYADVVVAFGASREIYAFGIDAQPEQLLERWAEALASPLQPQAVDSAPCQEIVLSGKDVDLCKLPVPVWTPGIDPGPFFTATCVI